MAAELLLVNPRRRRRGRKAKSSARRKRRTRTVRMARNPRRRRARKMSALQRKFFGGGKRRRRSSRAVVLARNPRRRRRSGFSVFRRNPSPLSNPVGYMEDALVPAAAGAVGGIAIDYLFSNITTLSGLSPLTQQVAKLGVAALLGVGVGMATNKQTGALVAGGAMTITVYDIIGSYLQNSGSSFAPQGQLGKYTMRGARRMGWWSPARTSGMGRFVPMNGVGRYVN